MDAIALLKKYYDEGSELYSLLLRHSQMVGEKALEVAQKHPEWEIDKEFLYEAALLHDIGVYLTDAPRIHCFGKEPYVSHGYLGADILRREGFEKHALVCERHTGSGLTMEDVLNNQLDLPWQDFLPVSLEEKIICFADKFYSKGRPDEVRTITQIRQTISRYGWEALQRWDDLVKLFLG
ncbi:phosphohydrolase [Bacteroidia bacterium]|nr:phosphohydrolase [Bacteroidia bacterium]